jgi:hypothetical protein
MKFNYKLYLDDERIPSSPWAKDGMPVIIVRNMSDFQETIFMLGLPASISFDHDLGENQKTGYDVAKWLVDQEYDLRNIEIHVHSANPVGRDNIYGIINSWTKFLDNGSN